MRKDMYAAFTDELMNNKNNMRRFWIYYQYDNTEKKYPLVVNRDTRENLDPTKPLAPITGRPVTFTIRDMGRWFRLMDAYIKNDDTLKVWIVDVENYENIRVVMAVGKNGEWKIRSQYEPAINKVMVGGLPQNTTLAYA